MKHVKTYAKRLRRDMLPRMAILLWSDPSVDGFSYSFVYEGGAKGILVTGGFAGVHEFHPLYQKGF